MLYRDAHATLFACEGFKHIIILADMQTCEHNGHLSLCLSKKVDGWWLCTSQRKWNDAKVQLLPFWRLGVRSAEVRYAFRTPEVIQHTYDKHSTISSISRRGPQEIERIGLWPKPGMVWVEVSLCLPCSSTSGPELSSFNGGSIWRFGFATASTGW